MEEHLVRRGAVERGPLPRTVRGTPERAIANPVALEITCLRREHLDVARVADKRPHANRLGGVLVLRPVVEGEVETHKVAHGKRLVIAEGIQFRNILRRIEVGVELPRHAHTKLLVGRRVLVDLRRPPLAAREFFHGNRLVTEELQLAAIRKRDEALCTHLPGERRKRHECADCGHGHLHRLVNIDFSCHQSLLSD